MCENFYGLFYFSQRGFNCAVGRGGSGSWQVFEQVTLDFYQINKIQGLCFTRFLCFPPVPLRLSDYLFTVARYAAMKEGREEKTYKKT